MGMFSSKKNRIFDSISPGPGSYSYAGKTVVCRHCGNNEFEIKSVLLNTPGLTFLGLDWANRSATILICQNCSQIQWFQNEPEREG